MRYCTEKTADGVRCSKKIGPAGRCGSDHRKVTSATTELLDERELRAMIADPFQEKSVAGRWGEFTAVVPVLVDAETLELHPDQAGTTLEWRLPGGGVIGRINLAATLNSDPDEPHLGIETIETHPAARNQGVAMKMLGDLWHLSGGKTPTATTTYLRDGRNHLSRYVLSLVDDHDTIAEQAVEAGHDEGTEEFWDYIEERTDRAEADIRHRLTERFGPPQANLGRSS